MKNGMLKKILAGMLAASVVVAMPLTASAAWKQTGGVWQWTENGQNATGWRWIEGAWYHFNASGDMTKGWLQENGTWYYLKGTGAMAQGWNLINGKWYCLNSNGSMRTGWVQTKGTWYFLAPNGDMQTGVVQVNGDTYYLDESGAMKTGKVEIDGKTYNFGTDGAVIGTAPKAAKAFSTTSGSAVDVPVKEPSKPSYSGGGSGSSSTPSDPGGEETPPEEGGDISVTAEALNADNVARTKKYGTVTLEYTTGDYDFSWLRADKVVVVDSLPAPLLMTLSSSAKSLTFGADCTTVEVMVTVDILKVSNDVTVSSGATVTSLDVAANATVTADGTVATITANAPVAVAGTGNINKVVANADIAVSSEATVTTVEVPDTNTTAVSVTATGTVTTIEAKAPVVVEGTGTAKVSVPNGATGVTVTANGTVPEIEAKAPVEVKGTGTKKVTAEADVIVADGGKVATVEVPAGADGVTVTATGTITEIEAKAPVAVSGTGTEKVTAEANVTVADGGKVATVVVPDTANNVTIAGGEVDSIEAGTSITVTGSTVKEIIATEDAVEVTAKGGTSIDAVKKLDTVTSTPPTVNDSDNDGVEIDGTVTSIAKTPVKDTDYTVTEIGKASPTAGEIKSKTADKLEYTTDVSVATPTWLALDMNGVKPGPNSTYYVRAKGSSGGEEVEASKYVEIKFGSYTGFGADDIYYVNSVAQAGAAKFVKDGGKEYYIDATGKRSVKSDFVTLGEDTFYVDADGAKVKEAQWVTVGGEDYYITVTSEKTLDDWALVSGTNYAYLGTDGVKTATSFDTATTVKGGKGTITGLTTAMEYRKGTEGEFTKVTNPDVELDAGSYEVRYAVDGNIKKAGPTATVTVEAKDTEEPGDKTPVAISTKTLQDALNVENVTEIKITESFELTESVEIPATVTLTFDTEKAITVNNGVTFTVNSVIAGPNTVKGVEGGKLVLVGAGKYGDLTAGTYNWNDSAWEEEKAPVTTAEVANGTDLKNALDSDTIVTINVTDNVELAATAELKTGVTLTVATGKTLTIGNDVVFTVSGKIEGATDSELVVGTGVTGMGDSFAAGKSYTWDTNSSKWVEETQKDPAIADVGTAVALSDALANSEVTTINLTADIADFSGPITIDRAITFNGQEHTINNGIWVRAADVTVENLNINITDVDNAAVDTTDAVYGLYETVAGNITLEEISVTIPASVYKADAVTTGIALQSGTVSNCTVDVPKNASGGSTYGFTNMAADTTYTNCTVTNATRAFVLQNVTGINGNTTTATWNGTTDFGSATTKITVLDYDNKDAVNDLVAFAALYSDVTDAAETLEVTTVEVHKGVQDSDAWAGYTLTFAENTWTAEAIAE